LKSIFSHSFIINSWQKSAYNELKIWYFSALFLIINRDFYVALKSFN
jgi:hypothetical protein